MNSFYKRPKTKTAFFLIASLLLMVGQLHAQDDGGCYEKNRSRGVAAMNKKEYDKAIGCFETAKVCPDKPSSNDLDAMIKKCEDAKKRIADYKKKADEKRKQEDVEKRFQEERELWEQEYAEIREAEMARIAYMNVIGCNFFNFYSGIKMSKSSDLLYAEDMTYLLPILEYDGLAEEERDVTLHCKLFDPNGNLLTDDESPYGYSYTKDITVKPGIGNQIRLEPWGWGMTFIPGNYVLEVYSDSARKIHKSTCSLVEKIPEVKTAKVRFVVEDSDASIYVNNINRGKGSCLVEFEYGAQCIVESRKANHTPTSQTITIANNMDGQVIELESPQPIFGSIFIESSPKFADVYIDGNKVGFTPLVISEILIGDHQLRLTKKGYKDYVDTITVLEEDNPMMKFKMSR